MSVIENVTLAILICACSFSITGAADSTKVELKYTPGEVTITNIKYDGHTRDYRFYVPKGFDKEKKHPLILVLHGFSQPIQSLVQWYSSAHAEADKDSTIMVYPVSTGSILKGNLTWNAKYGTLSPNTVDDIGFLCCLMDLFIQNMNCDPDRVYMTGISMGGAMTYTMSCHVPERLAAVAPVIMQMGRGLIGEYPNAKPLPILIITGSKDPLVPESGISKSVLSVSSMVDTLHYWKNRNKITGLATVTDLPDLCKEFTGGVESPSRIQQYVWESPEGNEVIWLHVLNGGHWLPRYREGKPLDPMWGIRLGTWNCDYDGAVAIYKFLLSHKRK